MTARVILPLIWSLSGALVVRVLASWSQLPERVAVHFDVRMQPNGWSNKTDLAAVALLAVVSEAAVATMVMFRAGSAAGLGGAILLTVNVVMVCAFWQVINYNVSGAAFRMSWILLPLIVLFAGTAVFLTAQMFALQRH